MRILPHEYLLLPTTANCVGPTYPRGGCQRKTARSENRRLGDGARRDVVRAYSDSPAASRASSGSRSVSIRTTLPSWRVQITPDLLPTSTSLPLPRARRISMTTTRGSASMNRSGSTWNSSQTSLTSLPRRRSLSSDIAYAVSRAGSTGENLQQGAALRGDELQTPLQRLVEPGPLALEESGWVLPSGSLRDETVRNHGTVSGGLTSEARTHLSGTAGGRIGGCRRCRGAQPKRQRHRRETTINVRFMGNLPLRNS